MSGKIVLVGFMGCGKSSIGQLLAERLQIPFEDTDAWIAAKQGRSITEIFQEQGEEAFREMETQCLERFCQDGRALVLATGGGLPEGGSNPIFSVERGAKNRQLLRKIGQVIYLKAAPEEIYQRVQHDTTRPLLQVEDPMKEICALMERRTFSYEQCAQIILDTSGKSKEEIVKEVLQFAGKETNK